MFCDGFGKLHHQACPQIGFSRPQLPVGTVHLWNLSDDLQPRWGMA